jgi:hypothetical protein
MTVHVISHGLPPEVALSAEIELRFPRSRLLYPLPLRRP